MAARSVWRGKEVLRSVQRATEAAINDVTERAAQDARANRWWASRSGTLAGEIVNERAVRRGKTIIGRFGTTKGRGFYGLFLEKRTPFLRPAADRQFPRLGAAIRRRL